MLGNLHVLWSTANWNHTRTCLCVFESRKVWIISISRFSTICLLQTLFFALCSLSCFRKNVWVDGIKDFPVGGRTETEGEELFAKKTNKTRKAANFLITSKQRRKYITWQLVMMPSATRNRQWARVMSFLRRTKATLLRPRRKSLPTRALIRINSAPCFMPFMAFSVLFNQFVCWY